MLWKRLETEWSAVIPRINEKDSHQVQVVGWLRRVKSDREVSGTRYEGLEKWSGKDNLKVSGYSTVVSWMGRLLTETGDDRPEKDLAGGA